MQESNTYFVRYTIHVPPEERRKIRRVEHRLNKMGIYFGRVMRKAGGPDPWQIANHMWLSVQLMGAAVGAYWKIRKFLKEHDFTDREIIRLDLYKHIQKPLKPKKAKRTSRKNPKP